MPAKVAASVWLGERQEGSTVVSDGWNVILVVGMVFEHKIPDITVL